MNLKKVLLFGGVAILGVWTWLDGFLADITYIIVGAKKKISNKEGVVIDFNFSINNNNDTKFKIVGFEGIVLFENYVLAKYYNNTLVEVAAKGTALLPVSIAIKWSQLLTNAGVVIEAFNKQEIILVFKGNYKVNLFGINFNVPYSFVQKIV